LNQYGLSPAGFESERMHGERKHRHCLFYRFWTVALVGIFRTKDPGWGRFSTSTLILTLVLLIASTLLVFGKLESSVVVNVLFAVVGFAGGLIADKRE
jgi:hypothetical protein